MLTPRIPLAVLVVVSGWLVRDDLPRMVLPVQAAVVEQIARAPFRLSVGESGAELYRLAFDLSTAGMRAEAVATTSAHLPLLIVVIALITTIMLVRRTDAIGIVRALTATGLAVATLVAIDVPIVLTGTARDVAPEAATAAAAWTGVAASALERGGRMLLAVAAGLAGARIANRQSPRELVHGARRDAAR